MINFPSKDYEEVRPVTFDFTADLGAESILTATVSAGTIAGSDSNPSAIITGGSTISGPKVIQSIGQGLIGVDYLLRCKITTSGGRTLVLSGSLKMLAVSHGSSTARKIVEALEAAALNYASNNGMVQEYQIAGRVMKFKNASDIEQSLNYWRAQLYAEDRADRIASGLPAKNKVRVRF